MALNLPKPVNTYAGEDELRHVNGRAAQVDETDDMGEYRPPKHSDKFKVGMIYPAPDVRSEHMNTELLLTCSRDHRQDCGCYRARAGARGQGARATKDGPAFLVLRG